MSSYGVHATDKAEASFTEDSALRPLDDLMEYLREYTRERPEVVALTCFGIGFLLGWRLRIW